MWWGLTSNTVISKTVISNLEMVISNLTRNPILSYPITCPQPTLHPFTPLQPPTHTTHTHTHRPIHPPGGGGSWEARGFFRDYRFKKANFEIVIFEIREVRIRDYWFFRLLWLKFQKNIVTKVIMKSLFFIPHFRAKFFANIFHAKFVKIVRPRYYGNYYKCK